MKLYSSDIVFTAINSNISKVAVLPSLTEIP